MAENIRPGSLKAPSLADFERMTHEAFERLPDEFRARCEGLIIIIEEFPDDDVMRDMGLESPFDLLGLYHGRGEPFNMGNEIRHGPDMIFIYRRAILDYWAEYDEPLDHIVTHVLVHEIGHHFGLSDEAMESVERQAR